MITVGAGIPSIRRPRRASASSYAPSTACPYRRPIASFTQGSAGGAYGMKRCAIVSVSSR
jgi:hypothetical protein